MANLQNVGGVRSSTLNLPSGDAGGGAQSRPVSAQDLMASFQRKTSAQNIFSSSLGSPAAVEKSEPVTQTGSSKDFLLNLLTKPKEVKPLPAHDGDDEDDKAYKETTEKDPSVYKLATAFAATNLQSPAQARASRETTPVRQFGIADSEQTPFEAPLATKASGFNYVNPFDQLHSSSPLNFPSVVPKPSEPKRFEILKHNRELSSNQNGESLAPVAKSRKLTFEDTSVVPADSDKGMSVSEALKGVGDKVDKEVEEALAQADLPKEDTATKPAVVAAGDNAADDTADPKQDVAHGDETVESSWESAEEEESEKSKEQAVKVYNFPMKPFVSIQIKEVADLLPIRQEHFMHVAKPSQEASLTRSIAHLLPQVSRTSCMLNWQQRQTTAASASFVKTTAKISTSSARRRNASLVCKCAAVLSPAMIAKLCLPRV